jgi:hypothetical protein
VRATWHQLGGIVRAEIKLHWRRRGLLVLLLGLAVVMLGTAVLQRMMVGAEWALYSPAERRCNSTNVLMILGPVTWVIIAVLLPPVLAETVPRDRQLGVHELLASLPPSGLTLLAGKLLGAWASVLLGLGGFGLLLGLVWLPILGSYDMRLYLDLWLVGLLPLAVYVAAISVLLAAGQPTRRRATLIGVVLVVLIIFTISTPRMDSEGLAGLLLVPNAWLWVLADGWMEARSVPLLAANPWLMPRLLVSAGAQEALVLLLAAAWIRRKERVG